mgnify:CR=1 FL=1
MQAAFIPLALALSLTCCVTGAVAQDAPPMTLSVERFDVIGDNPLDPAATQAAAVGWNWQFSGFGVREGHEGRQ